MHLLLRWRLEKVIILFSLSQPEKPLQFRPDHHVHASRRGSSPPYTPLYHGYHGLCRVLPQPAQNGNVPYRHGQWQASKHRKQAGNGQYKQWLHKVQFSGSGSTVCRICFYLIHINTQKLIREHKSGMCLGGLSFPLSHCRSQLFHLSHVSWTNY